MTKRNKSLYKDGFARDKLRKQIIEYIRAHPTEAVYHKLRKEKGIKLERAYNSIKEAYDEAGVDIPLITKLRSSTFDFERYKEDMRRRIIDYVRNHERINILELGKIFRCDMYTYFNSISEVYKLAGKDPNSPYKDSASRSVLGYAFEKEIRDLLKREFGEMVNYHPRKEGAVPDFLVKLDRCSLIIEVKCFKYKRLQRYHINQLKNYIELFGCDYGVLYITSKVNYDIKDGCKNICIIDGDDRLRLVEYIRDRM